MKTVKHKVFHHNISYVWSHIIPQSFHVCMAQYVNGLMTGKALTARQRTGNFNVELVLFASRLSLDTQQSVPSSFHNIVSNSPKRKTHIEMTRKQWHCSHASLSLCENLPGYQILYIHFCIFAEMLFRSLFCLRHKNTKICQILRAYNCMQSTWEAPRPSRPTRFWGYPGSTGERIGSTFGKHVH